MRFSRRYLSRPVRLALFGLAFVLPAMRAADSGGPDGRVVALPPFEVKQFRGSFDFTIRVDEKTGKLKAIAVTWVAPGIEARGVRVGDVVSAINGYSVARMSVDEVHRLLKHELAEDEVQLITFTGVRGFFRRSTSVIVRFTRPSEK